MRRNKKARSTIIQERTINSGENHSFQERTTIILSRQYSFIMKLLSVLHVSPKKVGDDKKPSPVHKSWENANIAQLACDEAKGWEACKDIVADGK